MQRRQTSIPRQWLVVDRSLGPDVRDVARTLPLGSGVFLVANDLPKRKQARLLARLRQVARARRLTVLDEAAGEAVRVHNSREIRRAGLARTQLLFLSPMFPTRSHPDWQPLRRMRAAALTQLARSPVIALGGMNERRFRRIRRLGFSGWAGIDAWRPRT